MNRSFFPLFFFFELKLFSFFCFSFFLSNFWSGHIYYFFGKRAASLRFPRRSDPITPFLPLLFSKPLWSERAAILSNERVPLSGVFCSTTAFDGIKPHSMMIHLRYLHWKQSRWMIRKRIGTKGGYGKYPRPAREWGWSGVGRMEGRPEQAGRYDSWRYELWWQQCLTAAGLPPDDFIIVTIIPRCPG